MLVESPVVVASASLEREKGWRRRLLESFPQVLFGFDYIEAGLLVKPEAAPIGNAENIKRLNRIGCDLPGKELGECHIQRTRDPQIDRKHGRLLAGSPFGHRCWTDSQYSRKTSEALGVGRGPEQTGQLLSAQEGGRIKSSADQVLDLAGRAHFPVWRFRRKKRIAGISIHRPFGAEPLLAASAMPQRTALAEQGLGFPAISADHLQGAAMVGAVLHDFQSPKQRHVYRLAVLAPTVEALRAPSGHTACQQLGRQNRLPRKHGEMREIRPPSEPSDHRREASCSVADAVDGGGEAPCSGSDNAGKHVAASSIERKQYTVIQGTGRNRMCFSEAGEVAGQALDRSCSEGDRIEMVEMTVRGKLDVTEIPGFVFNHLFNRHVRLHD